jgi:hypothetical protein
MDKKILEQLIDKNLSTREIAEKTNKSQTTIRWWLKHFGLETKINPYNKGGLAGRPKQIRIGDRKGEIKPEYFCERCGETNPSRFYHPKGRCKNCHNTSSVERFRKYKKIAVDYKGGKCIKCGYNKCLGSLDFHHVDPDKKDPKWRVMKNWRLERVKDELDKCILVCKNCHGEIHYRV